MRLEDETLLSAYLDGELDPDQRQRVESALLSAATLADCLHGLTAVRDLVADLSRPAPPFDLASGIIARMGRHQPGKTVRLGPWRLTSAQWIERFRAAAMLILVMTLGLLSAFKPTPPDRRRHPEVAQTPQPAARAPSLATLHSGTTLASRTDSPPQGPSPSHDQGRASVTSHDHAEIAREQIREWLDSPSLHKILIVTDKLGGHATSHVDQLIQKTRRSRPDYGRITVSQGIVIDPRHPDEAIVFALVMDDDELEQFQRQLKQTFPDAVEKADADPEVVTQLADVGQVAILPGTPPPKLDSPTGPSPLMAQRVNLGAKALDGDPNDGRQTDLVAERESGHAPVDQVGTTPARNAPGADRHSPSTSLAGPPSPPALTRRRESGHRGPVPDDPTTTGRAQGRPRSIVLVWVTTRDPSDVSRR